MFAITEGKGFQMTFSNGYTVRVQWGRGNYADNRYDKSCPKSVPEYKSKTAEIAVWDKDDNYVTDLPGMTSCIHLDPLAIRLENVVGWANPEDVVHILAVVADM
jgi:hypothetical protein